MSDRLYLHSNGSFSPHLSVLFIKDLNCLQIWHRFFKLWVNKNERWNVPFLHHYSTTTWISKNKQVSKTLSPSALGWPNRYPRPPKHKPLVELMIAQQLHWSRAASENWKMLPSEDAFQGRKASRYVRIRWQKLRDLRGASSLRPSGS